MDELATPIERRPPLSTSGVLIRVFGGLSVEEDGEPVSIGGHRQRRLLALLVARLDTVATNDWLAEYLWTDGDRPEAVAPAIRTYMSRLRQALPESARDWIETEASGYRLAAPDDAVDHRRFSLMRAAARDARDREDPQAALTLLDDALALWRGEPFRELEELDWARAEIEQLQLDRLEVQEERWEAALALGRHTQITGELAAFTAEHRLRDRAAQQYALALHRSGRTTEALRVIDDHRRTLAAESGLDPSVEVIELERAILDDDPALRVEKVGRPLRGYRLLEEIGAGSFSIVWRAIQPSVDREVAVKQIRSGLASQPDFIRRFEAEAHLVARIEHPHIVPLIDYWRDPDSAYLVMRWLRGGTLERRLDEGPLSEAQTVTLARQIGGALDAAHAKGVVHRDVKTANIFFDEDDNAFLGDFGIALEVAESSGPEAALSPGSPAYASPEQIRQERLGPEADIFSLGVVLYECLAGTLPFAGAGSPHDLVELQLAASFPPVSDVRPDVSSELADAIGRATAQDPADRFASVADFTDAMEPAGRTLAKDGAPGRLVGSAGDGSPNPYQGLHAFTDGDGDRFFGRERLVTELVGRFEQGGAASRCVVIVGPSGSGKSSVVRAGLVPALRRGAAPGSEEWFTTTMVPGSDPFEALEAALLRIAVNPPTTLLDQLRDGPRGIIRGARRCLGGDNDRLVLVIDQFEEVFIGESAAQADAFLDALSAAVDDPTSPLRVVVTLRADYYHRPLEHPTFAPILKEAAVDVTPLAPDELEQAIVEPARRLGATFEPGLVARISADVTGQPSALPLLQYTLHELFERRALDELTMQAYDELGGVTGALAVRAESLYADADDGQRGAIRRLLGQMTDPGEGSVDLRRRVAIADLSDDRDAQWVLDRFGEARLIAFDRDVVTREPTVEVAHEALLREWPRLSDWLDEDRDELRSVNAIGLAATAWDDSGRTDSDLYRGGRLEHAVGLALAAPDRLRALDTEFIDASRVAAEAERDVERRRVRRLRRFVAGTAAALVVSLIAGGLALRSQQRAVESEQRAVESQQRAVESEQRAVESEQRAVESQQRAVESAEDADLATLISRSAAQAPEDPELSLLLALEAHRREPGPATDQAIMNALATNTIATRVSQWPVINNEDCRGATSDGYGEFLVIDSRLIRRDLTTGDMVDFGPSPTPCGRWMGDVGSNRRWMRSEEGDRMWLGALDAPWAVELEFDERTIGQSIESLPHGWVSIESSLDGRPTTTILDAVTGEAIGSPVRAGAFLLADEASPDGSMLALAFGTMQRAEGEGETVVVDTATGDVMFSVDSALPAAALTFDPTSNELVAAMVDGTLTTIDLDAEEIVAEVESGSTSEISDVLLDDDGLVMTVSQGEIAWIDRRNGPTGRTVQLRNVGYAFARDDGLLFTESVAGDQIGILDPEGSALVDRSWDVDPFAHVAFNAGRASNFVFPDGAAKMIDLENGQTTELHPLADDGTPFFPNRVYPETDGLVGNRADGLYFRTSGREIVERVELDASPYGGTRYEDMWAVVADHGDERRVSLVNVARGELGVVFAVDAPDATEAHPTREGGMHVIDADGTLRTYGPEGSLTGEIDTGANDVTLTNVDPTTGKLALANFEGGSWIVDPSTGEVDLLSDRDLVANLAFARNGELLVITDPNGTVRLWDVRRGVSAGVVWNGTGASPSSPSWYDDQTETIWVYTSGMILQIPVNPDSWLERACEIVGRELSQDEWDQFVPGDDPLQPACP